MYFLKDQANKPVVNIDGVFFLNIKERSLSTLCQKKADMCSKKFEFIHPLLKVVLVSF